KSLRFSTLFFQFFKSLTTKYALVNFVSFFRGSNCDSTLKRTQAFLLQLRINHHVYSTQKETGNRSDLVDRLTFSNTFFKSGDVRICNFFITLQPKKQGDVYIYSFTSRCPDCR